MIQAVEVCALLKEYALAQDEEPEELLPLCRRGLDFVLHRLRRDADENDPLIAKTAAALAKFYLFERQFSGENSFQSHKAGDMTIQRNLRAELDFERQTRDAALAEAAEILRDGGFFFGAK